MAVEAPPETDPILETYKRYGAGDLAEERRKFYEGIDIPVLSSRVVGYVPIGSERYMFTSEFFLSGCYPNKGKINPSPQNGSQETIVRYSEIVPDSLINDWQTEAEITSQEDLR